MTGFQTATYALQAPGIAGDFASVNPYATLLSTQVNSQTGINAGPNGLTIGLFCWFDPATYAFANNYGSGAPNGFVGNSHQALITTYLSPAGMTIPSGFQAPNLYDAGDFWVVNNGSTIAVPGQKAYANNATGVASFASSGNPTVGATSTASTIAAGSFSVTGSIADNVLTVTAVGSGTIYAGALLTAGAATGTTVVSQITGTTGGVGTYLVSPRDQTVASTTITGTYGLLTVGGTVTGTYAVGDLVYGSGVSTGTVITALGTGTGGAGTYIVNLTQTVSSEAINVYSTTETGWFCRSVGQPGDVVKISSRAMG